jgi:hypothetical protein
MCVCYEGQNVKYTSPVYLCESEWRNVRVPENSQILFVLQHGIRAGDVGRPLPAVNQPRWWFGRRVGSSARD